MSDPEPVTIENPDLIVAIFEQMNADRVFTTNALLDGYKASYEKAQATLDAIRWQVRGLLDGDYMPTPAALNRALWPNEEVVEKFMPGEE